MSTLTSGSVCDSARTPSDKLPAPLVDRLAGLQDAAGCMASRVRLTDGTVVEDRNAFVTALVLRALDQCDAPGLAAIRKRGLDWVERARSPQVPGAFGFWPEGTRPPWAAHVPPDADDTAVILTELLRAGRIGARDALSVVCRVLLQHRVRPSDAGQRPVWVLDGCFRTWLLPGPANPVDVVANVNVVALLATLDARHLPGYDAGVATVRAGLDWAAGRPARLSALTPFYAGPSELSEALVHAVHCGVDELAGAARDMGEITSVTDPDQTDQPRLRNAYGSITWAAPALQVARTLAQTSGSERERSNR